jgi:hypothetical protein
METLALSLPLSKGKGQVVHDTRQVPKERQTTMLQDSTTHTPLGTAHQLAPPHRDLVIGWGFKADGRRLAAGGLLTRSLGKMHAKVVQSGEQAFAETAIPLNDASRSPGVGLKQRNRIG